MPGESICEAACAVDMARYGAAYASSGLAGGTRVVSENAIRTMFTREYEIDKGVYYGHGLASSKHPAGYTLVGQKRSARVYFDESGNAWALMIGLRMVRRTVDE